MSVTNILVVDDDIVMCRIVRHMLSGAQYKVETCHSVTDALAAIEQKAFDVYVIDYKLPDGSGLDVADRIARTFWLGAMLKLIGRSVCIGIGIL